MEVQLHREGPPTPQWSPLQTPVIGNIIQEAESAPLLRRQQRCLAAGPWGRARSAASFHQEHHARCRWENRAGRTTLCRTRSSALPALRCHRPAPTHTAELGKAQTPVLPGRLVTTFLAMSNVTFQPN